VCSEDYWFPNIGNAFDGFRARFDSAREGALEEFSRMNRHERRRAKKGLSDRAFKKFADQTAREVEEHYGVAEGAFGEAFGLYSRGKISGEEASRRLFSSIAKPTAFIHFYFRKYAGKKDLPEWMRSIGESIQSAIETTAREFSRFPVDDIKRLHPEALERWREKLSSTIAGSALGNGEEFGLNDEIIRSVQSHREVTKIPCCANMLGLIGEYVAQCIGLRGPKAKVEPSFGGDLIHAMYIPHVNIWRSDRRFSKLAENCGVEGSTMIVPKLTDLPDAIDRF
jgi:hypothetical protein